METIKSVLGYGTKEHEGQEPVSGQQGTGNAAEPYDAGNSEDTSLGGKAPQLTDATSTSAPIAHSTRPEIPTPKPSEQFPTTTDTTTSSDKPLGSSLSDELSPSATSGTSSSAVPTSTLEETSTPFSRAEEASISTSKGEESSAPFSRSEESSIPTSKAEEALSPFSKPAEPSYPTSKADETSTSQLSSDEPTKTGGIGGSDWMKTALPIVGDKNKSSVEDSSSSNIPATSHPESSTTAGASQATEDSSSLPPNHLPTHVPEGVSTDFAPPQTPAAADTPAATTTSDPTPSTTTSESTSALPSTTRDETTSSLPSTTHDEPTTSSPSTTRDSDEPATAELPGTKAPTHTSRFAEDDPDAHRGNNPSSIPIAGGKPLGVAAVEERKEAGLPADPGPNLPQSVIGNPSAGHEHDKSAPGAASTTTTSGSSDVHEGEKEGKEGKHKHHLLQKIKDKIKH